MKILARALALATLLLCLAAPIAHAIVEPESKTLEQTLTYDYDTLKIQIDQWLYAFKKHDLRFFIVNLHLGNPTQMQTAFAGEAYSKRNVEAPSDIAARHNAVLAINGDYYNYKDDYGMIIRNGMLYRSASSTRDHLLVYADGTFKGLFAADYIEGAGEQYIADGVVQSFAFGPLLVDGGKATTMPDKYIVSTDDTIREPRTAIGMVDKNHYVIIVADGRRNGWSEKGMTLQELQQVFIEQGCSVAYNLDGGGSTTLVVNGEKLNRSSGSRERDVSDIVYFIQ
ncbi:MAG: phosphodiester glycosidase family protein [Clostridia bacterium]|nr:phosphodiester glycosidase family protein [Clostridia bacterium]